MRHTRPLSSRSVSATLVAEGDIVSTPAGMVTSVLMLMVIPLYAAPMIAGTWTVLARCFAASTPVGVSPLSLQPMTTYGRRPVVPGRAGSPLAALAKSLAASSMALSSLLPVEASSFHGSDGPDDECVVVDVVPVDRGAEIGQQRNAGEIALAADVEVALRRDALLIRRALARGAACAACRPRAEPLGQACRRLAERAAVCVRRAFRPFEGVQRAPAGDNAGAQGEPAVQMRRRRSPTSAAARSDRQGKPPLRGVMVRPRHVRIAGCDPVRAR